MRRLGHFERLAGRWIGRLERMTEKILVGFLVVMMAVLFWQVFSRFVIKVPATWTEEAARYAFMYMAFFGAALGVRRSAHFGVTILPEKLRGQARRRYRRYAMGVPILAGSLLLLIYGTRYMLDFGFARISPTFHFPMAWVYLVVPLSAALMTLFAAYNVCFESFEEGEESFQDRRPEGGS